MTIASQSNQITDDRTRQEWTTMESLHGEALIEFIVQSAVRWFLESDKTTLDLQSGLEYL